MAPAGFFNLAGQSGDRRQSSEMDPKSNWDNDQEVTQLLIFKLSPDLFREKVGQFLKSWTIFKIS